MTIPAVLTFAFNGQNLSFPIEGASESVASPFTGRDLRKLKTVVPVASPAVDLVKSLLASSPLADADGALWSGSLDMESYTAENGPHTLTITWSEWERVHADTVEFEGLALVPTRYEERDDGEGVLIVSFQANLSPDETEIFRGLLASSIGHQLYWPVVRRGVSDDPRTMRFGRILWQTLEDGGFAHDITLVDEAHDADESSALLGLGGEPQVSNLIDQLLALRMQFERLLDEVQRSGVLTPQTVDAVRAGGKESGAARRYSFFEVSDLSKW